MSVAQKLSASFFHKQTRGQSVIIRSQVFKNFLSILLAAVLVLFLYSAASPQERELDLKFRKNKLSANIKNTPLEKVLEEFEDERDIQVNTDFIRDEALLLNKVSLELRDVSIQEGLDRILSGINYSLIFKGDKVVGVMLFGEPGKRSYRGRRAVRRTPYRRRP